MLAGHQGEILIQWQTTKIRHSGLQYSRCQRRATDDDGCKQIAFAVERDHSLYIDVNRQQFPALK